MLHGTERIFLHFVFQYTQDVPADVLQARPRAPVSSNIFVRIPRTDPGHDLAPFLFGKDVRYCG